MKYTLERQKLMLLFPIPLVLCLLLVFHGLGGGRDSAANHPAAAPAGINTSLPSARADTAGKPPDKVQLYASAAVDSARFREQQKEDPNIAGRLVDTVMHDVAADKQWPIVYPGIGQRQPVGDLALDQRRLDQPQLDQRRLAADETADKLLAKVKQLQRELDKSAPVHSGASESAILTTSERPAATDLALGPDPTLIRLSALSRPDQANPVAGHDPEMERIDAMLDKLIRIQHPDLVAADVAKNPAAVKTFVLEVPGEKGAVNSLQQGVVSEEEAPSGFEEIGESDKPDTARYQREPALEAVIDGDQTVISGSTVALRLVSAAVVNGLAVPSGQQLYGEVSLAGERLMIHISSLRVGDQVIPVSIQVYDLDGVVGVRVPGAVTRDVSKESASEAISGLGLASMDPSLTGQAANAGLQLAKTLTSRKVRTVRVQLPEGYRVLLVNTKTK